MLIELILNIYVSFKKFTFFILSIFLLPSNGKTVVDQDELVIQLLQFTSSSAIALPFDAIQFQVLKL